jgi:hypothetical protein
MLESCRPNPEILFFITITVSKGDGKEGWGIVATRWRVIQ